jgi:hypothetical protein
VLLDFSTVASSSYTHISNSSIRSNINYVELKIVEAAPFQLMHSHAFFICDTLENPWANSNFGVSF